MTNIAEPVQATFQNKVARPARVETTDKDDIASIEHRGCRFSYRVRGNGPPVVFIQGTGLHGEGWRPQIDGLAGEYRCLSFDNRGMGLSQPVGAPVTVAQMAEDTQVLMDALGWESAHIVGHSLGGPIALQLALTVPKRVRSLALLCTFANGRNALPLTPWALWVASRTRLGTARQRRRAFLQLVMPSAMLATTDRDALAAELEPLFGHDLGEQPPVVDAQLAAMRAFDATNRLGELAGVPTLVVSAEHDLIAPTSLGRKLASGIPDARYVEIQGAAHGVVIQCADKINDLLREHFAGVG